MRAINATVSRTVAKAQIALIHRYCASTPKSWRSVALALGIKSDAMLCRIAAGKQKPPNSVLIALKLKRARKPHPTRYKTIQQMSNAELRIAFENRTKMNK